MVEKSLSGNRSITSESRKFDVDLACVLQIILVFNRFVRNIFHKTYLSLYIACGNLIVNVNQIVGFAMANAKQFKQ